MSHGDLSIKREERPAVPGGEQTRPGRSFVPNADIRETEEALWLWADVPGVDENSIEVRLDDGHLHIHGRVALAEYADLSPLYTEYNVGNFARSFRIDSAIDSERISAVLRDGVLQLELPKAAHTRPRRVPVRGA
jgi:HSP20 family protein